MQPFTEQEFKLMQQLLKSEQDKLQAYHDAGSKLQAITRLIAKIDQFQSARASLSRRLRAVKDASE